MLLLPLHAAGFRLAKHSKLVSGTRALGTSKYVHESLALREGQSYLLLAERSSTCSKLGLDDDLDGGCKGPAVPVVVMTAICVCLIVMLRQG